MTESTAYVREGTEYNSNMSSDVTMYALERAPEIIINEDSHERECKGEHRRSVIMTGCSIEGVLMPKWIKA